MNNLIINHEAVEKIKDLYLNQNKSMNETADILGISLSSLKYYVRKFSIVKPKEKIVERRKQTNLQRYGVTAPLKSEKILDKVRKTNTERYGTECPLQNKEIKQKALNTMCERYGVEYSGENKALLQKMHDTFEKKSGYRYATQRGKAKDAIEILNSPIKLRKFIESLTDKTIFGISQALGYDRSSIEKKIKEYDLSGEYDPYYFTSSKEKEVKKFLADNGISVVKNKKIIWPKEIDLYDSGTNVGVEFNGSFYHSVQKKGKTYHQEKSLIGIEKGVRIYHIYEYEWMGERMREFIKNDLLDAFGKLPVANFVDCSLVEIISDEFEKFSMENFAYDILSCDKYFKLVSGTKTIAEFGVSFKDNAVFVGQIVVKLGVSKREVVTLVLQMSKKRFASNTDLYYTSNLDKEDCGIFQSLGFALEEILPPRLVYCTYYKGEHGFDDTLSEKERAFFENKKYFYKVYTAGSVLWRC